MFYKTVLSHICKTALSRICNTALSRICNTALSHICKTALSHICKTALSHICKTAFVKKKLVRISFLIVTYLKRNIKLSHIYKTDIFVL